MFCQTTNTQNTPPSIVGTWKAIDAPMHNGGKLNFVESYHQFTEEGIWSFQTKFSNPFESNREPESLEDYKAIVDSYYAAVGTYTVKGDSLVCTRTLDLRPHLINTKITGIYSITGDTLSFDVGNFKIIFLRQ
jgi:hypothetical protein